MVMIDHGVSINADQYVRNDACLVCKYSKSTLRLVLLHMKCYHNYSVTILPEVIGIMGIIGIMGP